MWLYDRKKLEYRRQAPHNTTVIGQYYTTLLENGETDCLVEDLLSRTESNAKPIISKLENGERLEHAERADLSFFIAFLFARTPKFERETHQIAESFHKLIAKERIPTVEAAEIFLAKLDQTTILTAESFHAFIHEEKYRIEGHRNITLDLMIEQARKAAKELVFMDWEVVHAPPKRSFITSDSPFGYIIPKHLRKSDKPILGLLSEDVTKVVPLTQKIALRIRGRGIGLGHIEVNRQELSGMNLAIATECERFLIGPNEDFVRYVVERSKIDSTKPGTQLRLESVTHPTDPRRSFVVCHRVSADNADRPFNPENLRIDH